MTCYLRMHEVLLGVSHREHEPEWDSLLGGLGGWPRQVLSVEDRDKALSKMGVEPIDVYDLPRADLGRFAGLIVSGRVDQEFLYRERDTIRDFLDHGKVLVFTGQMFRAWLPGGSPFVPNEGGAISSDALPAITDHPIFEGVSPEDLGASFVYAHGHHPVPEGAEVLVSLASREPAAYVDRRSTRGVILVLAGTDHALLGYAGSESPARRRIVSQLLSWIDREARQ
jgi:hypothetical protein